MTDHTSTQAAAFDVPADSETFDCPYCERPFASDQQRNLHLGEVHDAAIDDVERDEFAAANDDERDQLWLYHFKAVVILLVIYMLTGLAYLIVLSG